MASIPDGVRLAILGLAAAGMLLREFGIIDFVLPENRRLVPQTVYEKGTVRASLQFGYELGTGVRTYVPTSAPHLLALGIVLLWPPLVVTMAAGAVFGLARLLVPVGWLWGGQQRWARDFAALKSVTRRVVIVLVASGLALAAVG